MAFSPTVGFCEKKPWHHKIWVKLIFDHNFTPIFKYVCYISMIEDGHFRGTTWNYYLKKAVVFCRKCHTELLFARAHGPRTVDLLLYLSSTQGHTFDGRNPAPPGMYNTL